MPTVTIDEAQQRFFELIERLRPGEPIVITRNDVPVARLLAEAQSPRQPRKAGSAAGQLIVVTEDDEHLQEFEEYMG
jgi:prevent-host-death family protein